MTPQPPCSPLSDRYAGAISTAYLFLGMVLTFRIRTLNAPMKGLHILWAGSPQEPCLWIQHIPCTPCWQWYVEPANCTVQSTEVH